jgi:hypothetical protein
MNDKPRIFVGLAIALVVLTFPYWYALAAGHHEPRPELKLPAGGQCVRATKWMRAHHMDLLNQWRDEVVRQGASTPIEVNGHQVHKSLTRGCMSCHVDRGNFCTKCHTYANVRPVCWDCHVEPERVLNDG